MTTTSRGGAVARPVRRSGPQPASPVKRQKWLTVIAAIVVTVFVARLVQIQVIQAPALAAEATAARTVTVVSPAHRGEILDRNGVVLATSLDRYTLSADPGAIVDFRGRGREDHEGSPVADGALGVAQLMAPILGVDKAELAAQINGEERYVVLAKGVEPEQQRAIAALGLSAYIRAEMTSTRTYPANTVASPLLGFVDHEQVGQGGMERKFNDLLSGTNGVETFERGRDGVPIAGLGGKQSTASPGGDVLLTIDHDIQWKAQQEADAAKKRTSADYAIVIVKDNETGQLLALADSNSPDPNDRSSAAVAQGSRAVQDTFEPGSTGKAITVAAALELGAVTPGTPFVTPFKFTTPNGQEFKDAVDYGTQHLTTAGVLAKSSNTGTVQIGEKVPPAVQYDYLKAFGLGEYTGLDLPGEARGQVLPLDRWDGRTRYAVTFGQAMTVNAVQATNVFSTIANGGVSVPVSLILGTREAGSDRVTPVKPVEGSRVIDEDTATTLLGMMETVTTDGTATMAAIPGYRVSGKTATAEVWDAGRKGLMSSFIGVAPADNPRFTVSVFVKNSRTSPWGGVVAGPVFREVMGFVIQKFGLQPSAPATASYPIHW
jgi:cell division protein FtsI (penicillin-binding protein 3)